MARSSAPGPWLSLPRRRANRGGAGICWRINKTFRRQVVHAEGLAGVSSRASAINQRQHSIIALPRVRFALVCEGRVTISLAGAAPLHLEGRFAPTTGLAEPHDRASATPLRPGGNVLENLGVGGDVRHRMGEPVRRLRALLSEQAGR